MTLTVQTGENNPILRTRADEIVEITPQIRKLAKEMIITMNEEYGCGIAAPQIGEWIRLIITSRWKKNKNKLTQNGKPIIMINPVITKASSTMISDEEWCLSLPWIRGIVERNKSITVEYLDQFWNPKMLELSGLDATIVQHEVDHIDWILFIDRAEKVYPI